MARPEADRPASLITLNLDRGEARHSILIDALKIAAGGLVRIVPSALSALRKSDGTAAASLTLTPDLGDVTLTWRRLDQR